MPKKGKGIKTRKIRKISPGAYIFPAKALFEGLMFGGGLHSEELIYGGKFAFQNRLGYLIVGRNFTIFSLFYFVLEDTIFKHKPPGAYIRRGHLTKRFLRYGFEGHIFGGAYTWRGLFSEFDGMGRTKDRCMAIYN